MYTPRLVREGYDVPSEYVDFPGKWFHVGDANHRAMYRNPAAWSQMGMDQVADDFGRTTKWLEIMNRLWEAFEINLQLVLFSNLASLEPVSRTDR